MRKPYKLMKEAIDACRKEMLDPRKVMAVVEEKVRQDEPIVTMDQIIDDALSLPQAIKLGITRELLTARTRIQEVVTMRRFLCVVLVNEGFSTRHIAPMLGIDRTTALFHEKKARAEVGNKIMHALYGEYQQLKQIRSCSSTYSRLSRLLEESA